jgi:acetate CoA/acetoacetate CoA-transferase beta subunit
MNANALFVRRIPERRRTFLERGPGVTVEQVIAGTEAKLVVPNQVPEMRL